MEAAQNKPLALFKDLIFLVDWVKNKGYSLPGGNITKDMKDNIMSLLFKIIYSDMVISEDEIKLINEFFNLDLNQETLRKMALYRLQFWNIELFKNSAFIQKCIEVDLFEGTNYSRYIVEYLKEICISVAAVDMNTDYKEIEAWTPVIQALEKQLDDKNIRALTNFEKANINIQFITSSHSKDGCDENKDNQDDYTAYIKELNDLIGLEKVKQDVNTIVNIVRVRELRKKNNLPTPPMSMHLVFTGNPGTGKTTVARLLAKIYKALGVLSKGQLIEVDRSGLVAGYVGQTSIKVQEVVEKALGGILFIDEAYSLISGRTEGDYGYEAVDILLKAMEDKRDDFIVIVAGYIDKMEEFLNSNPGLRSRFNKFISFEDYTSDELNKIFNQMCEKSGYKLTKTSLIMSETLLKKLVEEKDQSFANGRTVRNIFEKVISNQANRVVTLQNPSKDDLITLDTADFNL